MEQRPKVMSVGGMIGATELAKRRVQGWLDLAAEVQGDAKKPERQARLECKACFYGGRLGGAAITSRACMSCGSKEFYSSTATDVLCKLCAANTGLCKHCGGDREMRVRRKGWPSGKSVEVVNGEA